MKKLAFATFGLVALVATPATAADLARPVVKAPPPPVYVFSWTGCYVGGNIGGAWVDKDFSLNSVSTPFGVITPAFGPVGLGGHTASSFIGGVQAGCNYQVPGSGFVFGIQGDYDWLKADGSHVDPIVALTTLQSNAKSLASVTGRVGYAWDRFLGYVKGGGAWERDEYTWFVTADPTIALSASETRSGWTVGIGAEYAFTNWITGFVEYDYYDFGTRTVDFPVFAAPLSVNLDIKERKSVVKVGLNFLFGAGPGPVAARY